MMKGQRAKSRKVWKNWGNRLSLTGAGVVGEWWAAQIEQGWGRQF